MTFFLTIYTKITLSLQYCQVFYTVPYALCVLQLIYKFTYSLFTRIFVMRDSELIELRNKHILLRFKELKQEYRNTHVILRKMRIEFYLSTRRLEAIIFNRKERASHQISIFND